MHSTWALSTHPRAFGSVARAGAARRRRRFPIRLLVVAASAPVSDSTRTSRLRRIDRYQACPIVNYTPRAAQ